MVYQGENLLNIECQRVKQIDIQFQEVERLNTEEPGNTMWSL